jgi:hypothetical protein
MGCSPLSLGVVCAAETSPACGRRTELECQGDTKSGPNPSPRRLADSWSIVGRIRRTMGYSHLTRCRFFFPSLLEREIVATDATGTHRTIESARNAVLAIRRNLPAVPTAVRRMERQESAPTTFASVGRQVELRRRPRGLDCPSTLFQVSTGG